MPTRSLSNAEIEQLTSWPASVAHSDLVAFFNISVDDLRWVRSYRGAANHLGLSVQLCTLPFLGFIPDDLSATPAEVAGRLANELGSPPAHWTATAATLLVGSAVNTWVGLWIGLAGEAVVEASGKRSGSGW